MEIVQAEVPDEEANEVLRRVHSAVQNMQQSSGVMDTNEQVHAQLDSGEVAILSGSGDSTAGWCLLFTVYLNISMQVLPKRDRVRKKRTSEILLHVGFFTLIFHAAVVLG